MKRFVLLSILFLSLTSCDVITEIPDDEPIVKDDIEDILNDDDDDENPVEEKTDEETITYFVDQVFAQMETENAYSISHDVEVAINYVDTSYSISSSRIQTSIEMEREEQYYFERVQGQFEYADPENPFESTNASRLIDGRTGNLLEYDIADNYVEIVQQYDDQTFLELMETEETPYDIDFDIEDFLTLERQPEDEQYVIETGHHDYKYDITMKLFDFANEDLIWMVSALGIPDIENEEIDLFLNVNEWYILYRFDYKTTFTMDDMEFDLIIRTESRFHYTDHIQEKISVFESPYVLVLPTSKDDILFTSSIDSMPWHGLLANQEGWTRQDVEPGIYMVYIDTLGFVDPVEYTIYDEGGNIITFDQRLEVTEPTTFYVKLLCTEDAQASVVFKKQDIEDIVIDHTHDITSGTITGYNEGQDDLSLYYLQGTTDVSGYLEIDVSSVNSHVYRDDLFLMTMTTCPEDQPNCQRYADYCSMTEEETCIAFIEPGTEYVFDISGEDVGDFTFTYTFIEDITYPSELHLMYEVDDFEPGHLFHISQGQDIYLKFEILIYDTYYFRVKDTDSYYQRVTYELYDEDGVLQEENWQGYYDLARGYYYIKLTTIQTNEMFTLELIQD